MCPGPRQWATRSVNHFTSLGPFQPYSRIVWTGRELKSKQSLPFFLQIIEKKQPDSKSCRNPAIIDTKRKAEVPEEVETVACASMLRNSDATKSRVEHLLKGLRSLNSRLHPAFFENKDVFEETVEQLEGLLSAYE